MGFLVVVLVWAVGLLLAVLAGLQLLFEVELLLLLVHFWQVCWWAVADLAWES